MPIKFNGKDITPRFNGKNISRVMYNGKQIYPNVDNNVIEIQKANAVAGDICAFDGTNKRFFRFVDSGATDDIKKYTPIGVVVVPTSHTDDGTTRIISLANMDCNNPDSGNTQSYPGIYWGGYNKDVPDLLNLVRGPWIGTSANELTDTQILQGWNRISEGYFSSDYYDSYPNPFDEGTYFGGLFRCLPSPYLTGGLKNEIYHSLENAENTLADMDGKGNTEKILALDNKADTSWQTSTGISNVYSPSSIHPAAQCCWRYHTIGTQQGDWYLPSIGELGYLAARRKKIDISIEKIIHLSTSTAITLSNNYSWWSSIECSSQLAILLYLGSSRTNPEEYSKSTNNKVRAFLAV